MNEKNPIDDGAPNGDPAPNLATTNGDTPPTPFLPDINQTTTKIIQQKLKVTLNRSSTNHSPIPLKAILIATLVEFQKVDPTFTFLPTEKDSTASAITKASELPNDEEKLKKYVTDPENSPGNHNTIQPVDFYIRTSGEMSVTAMKKDNTLFRWLQSKQIFFKAYKFETTYDAVPAGFISGMSTTLHYRDQVNEVIQNVLKESIPGVEVHLVPTSMRYGTAHEKRNVQVVQYQVDRKFVQEAREAIVTAFQDKKDELPADIFFVPSPMNGSINHELFYNLLGKHHEQMTSIRSFAVTNVPNMKNTITVGSDDDVNIPVTSTLHEVIMNAKIVNTKIKIFSSVENTNYSATEGRYLLVTDKHKMKHAETFMDDLITHIHKHDDLRSKFSIDGEPIRRVNRVKTSTKFDGYTNFLIEKSKIPSTIETNAPPNFWKNRQNKNVRTEYTSEEMPEPEQNKKMRTSNETDTTCNMTDADSSEGVIVDIDAELQKEREFLVSKLDEQNNKFEEALRIMRIEFGEKLTEAVNASEQRMTNAVSQHLEAMTKKSDQAMSRMEKQSHDALSENDQPH